MGTDEELMEDELIAATLNWISLIRCSHPWKYRQRFGIVMFHRSAVVYPYESDKVRVVFKDPQRAITPGQAVAFYDNDTVVGGDGLRGKVTTHHEKDTETR